MEWLASLYPSQSQIIPPVPNDPQQSIPITPPAGTSPSGASVSPAQQQVIDPIRAAWAIGGPITVILAIIFVMNILANLSSAPNKPLVGAAPGEARPAGGQVEKPGAEFKQGESQYCKLTNLNNGNIIGEFYSVGYRENLKLRLNLKINDENNQKVERHVIVSSLMAYVWTNQSNRGLKLPLTVNNPDQMIDKDQKEPIAYSCSGWAPDDSKFDRPDNIKFFEIVESDGR